jgi:aerobic-type carbon monoxide dehydrogenase small subunit (CoxS/CutS family)
MSAEALRVHLAINGHRLALEVQPHQTLLEALRDQAGLTGTKECCSEGECGACTVLLNGRAVTSCLVLAAEAENAEVITIEGLSTGGTLDALQQAFVASGAVQCGFCIPGMIMSAKYLLMTNPSPTIAEIKEGLVGNLCRCGGYSRIVAAVAEAARKRD